MECDIHGMIFSGSDHFFYAKDPGDEAVITEIVHCWTGQIVSQGK